MKKILSFKTDNKELTDMAFHIRTKVFVEEQDVDKELEFDGLDDEAVQYILFFDSIPVATSRRRITEEGFKLERLAVLKDYRGKGAGRMLMEKMMDEILPTKSKLYLYAQAVAEGVYEKLGFKRVGDMFYEANIKHYKMVYKG